MRLDRFSRCSPSGLHKPSFAFTPSVHILVRIPTRPSQQASPTPLRSLLTPRCTSSSLQHWALQTTTLPRRSYASSSAPPAHALDCFELLLENPELSEEDARLEYGWIASHVVEATSTHSTSSTAKNQQTALQAEIRALCERRAASVPLQYLLGTQSHN